MSVDVLVAGINNLIFDNVKTGDLLFALNNSNSGVHFGTVGNSNAVMAFTHSNVKVGGCNTNITFLGNTRVDGTFFVNSPLSLSGIKLEASENETASIIVNDIPLKSGVNSYFVTSNLGVLKSNPQYPLDVVGTINAGNILLSNNPLSSLYAPISISNTINNFYSSATGTINASNILLSNTPLSSLYSPISTSNTLGSIYYNSNLTIPGNISFNGSLLQNGIPYQGSQFTSDGSNIYIVGSNVGLGTSNPNYQLHVIGDIFASQDIVVLSDGRFKENLEIIPNPVEKIKLLTGYTFDMRDPETGIFSAKRNTGLIAQDVDVVLPEAVYNRQHLGIAYGNLAGLFVEAIKELEHRISALELAATR